jgi:4-aminobutyrate aminotransferase-like enzyme/Ser/Thr protein kinase RdoA (MazF antagonist)
MKALIQREFDLEIIAIEPLAGYENQNFLIETESGKYVFKTYPFDADMLALIEAENDLLLFLGKSHAGKYPEPVPFKDDSMVKCMNIDGKSKILRMLTFIDGDFLADVHPTKELYQSLGKYLAQLDLNLISYDNYIFKARQWEWDIQYLHLNRKYIPEIPDPKARSLVRYFFMQFDENILPILPNLRKSIIYNDANEWNILVKENEILGFIDFGDIAYSPLINELAVAMTYAIYNEEDSLTWATTLLKSYHQVLPIEEKEVSILYYLIAARLCISVCNAAHAKVSDPANTYALISEEKAWKMLNRWLQVNPVSAENKFREAIGLYSKQPKPVEEIIKERHQVISPVLSLTYTQPIHMVRAAFQYMYDAEGNTFLDAYNNIPHVGHSHPKVVEAGQRQMAKLNTNTRYLYDVLNLYAEKLMSKFPPSLNKVFFVNSGSAASDLAIRLAQTYTGYKNIMVMQHGYHGHTQTDIDISDYKFSNKKGQGQKDYIIRATIPDTYRGKYTKDDGSAGKSYAQETITQIHNSSSPIATFISEPIVGCAGQVPLAKGYLKEIYPAVREQGGVCISDEVQTGFGRLGDFFWGFEAQDVVPDIVIIGKPMGNGHPMGAVITTSEIADVFSQGVEFFSSFGGNPVSCAIGLAVLEVIEEEGLQENAKVVGEYYKSRLIELQREFPVIGDVRGSGLFLGVDIVKAGSKDENTLLANSIKNALRNQHILISTDGPLDNVLKTKPPLCFNKRNVEQVIEQIYQILNMADKNRG